MTRPRVTVVIRTKDEAEDLGGVLDALASQGIAGETETIVVDSGSSDDTVEIARGHGAQVIEIPPETFSFGGALNTGCEAAGAPIVLSLSGHAYPPDDGWLERMLGPFDDERVACCTGAGAGPTGETLNGTVVQDFELARRHPYWGYSNAAGAFRRALWRERPFRDDMPGTEDKEWAWYWLQHGRVVVLDPSLNAVHDHTRDPVRESYRRARVEWRGFSMYLDVPPASLLEIARLRWNHRGPDRGMPRPSIAAALVGEYVERRQSRR